MVNKINNQTVSILMRGQIPVQEAPDEQAARRVEVRQAAPEQRQDMSKYRENKLPKEGNCRYYWLVRQPLLFSKVVRTN